MKAYSRFIVLLGFTAVLAGIAPAFFPTHLEARNPTPGVVSPEGSKLGGEPGEDPHLRVKPIIRIETDADLVGCDSGGKTGDADVYGTQAAGMREGRGSSFGSRVNCAWRTLFWTWLWQMQR